MNPDAILEEPSPGALTTINADTPRSLPPTDGLPTRPAGCQAPALNFEATAPPRHLHGLEQLFRVSRGLDFGDGGAELMSIKAAPPPAPKFSCRHELAGKIQERYGVAKNEAEKQLAAWERKMTDAWFTKN